MSNWTTLQEYDRWACVRRLPPTIRAWMETMGPSVLVAGGYVRSCVTGEPINDIDMFVSSKAEAEDLAGHLSHNSEAARETPNSWSLTVGGYAVQVIHRWTFGSPKECAESFDFTIAKSAIWHDGSWQTICHPQFYSDLAAKRLVYTSPVRNEDAGGSMLRVLKFYTRNYRIPLESLAAVVARLYQGVNVVDPAAATEAGITKILTGLLREVDPLIDPFAAAHIGAPQEI